MKTVRLDRLLSNLGYCTRSEVGTLIKQGGVQVLGQKASSPSQKVLASDVTVHGEALDPEHGMLVMLHKPADYVCSHDDEGSVVYELFPERWACRNPKLSSIGRLDKDTTGLLLFTDDGKLLQKITAPKSKLGKVYDVTLAEPLRGDEKEIFASGTYTLEGDDKPLLPAELEIIEPQKVRLTIHEGRYHQVKRMFAGVGNLVTALHRSKIGGLTLLGLAEGEYKLLDQSDIALLFSNSDDA